MTYFTVVNVFTLKNPDEAAAFENRFGTHVQWMREREGFQAHQAVRQDDEPATYVNFGWWDKPESFQAVMASDTFQAHAKEFHELVDVVADPSLGVLSVEGQASAGDAPLVALEFIEAKGDQEEFEAAYAAYAQAAARAAGFAWADLAKSLFTPGKYTAVTRWEDRDGFATAKALPQYAALTALATIRTVTAAPVAGTRTPEGARA
ncbi:antibiotic biosynthesis monooxygenase [Streptomyces sp. PTM05]|uniref:Antibiotic biosynthesis monooxygenase n=1 Tax=Streptantibioticus parmotrematis TaxID=2873249 RepID=A0ABS7QT82_9ACTN|nr:antibiotic biosynthesis monooxygenase family protein [Streptantibioticus parmotrematis]MBY8886404.1 antibiotic biosynthesis monooxygenase [Streptantibioticus parmotrematis]